MTTPTSTSAAPQAAPANQVYEIGTTLSFVPQSRELIEGTKGPDKGPSLMRVRGKFQQAHQPNEQNLNQRTYLNKLWERVFADPRFKERLTSRGMFGELDHPSDGITKLSRASHIITDLQPPDENGDIWGEAVILNTKKGQDLQAIFEAAGRVGASSRGKGQLKADGHTVDESDYEFDTIDFVESPSTHNAYAAPIVEEAAHGGLVVDPENMDGAARLSLHESLVFLQEAEQHLPQTVASPSLSSLTNMVGRLCEETDDEPGQPEVSPDPPAEQPFQVEVLPEQTPAKPVPMDRLPVPLGRADYPAGSLGKSPGTVPGRR